MNIAPCMPVEMPDLRNEFISKWATSPGWKATELVAIRGESMVQKDFKMGAATIGRSIQAHVTSLEQSELFWVGPEMCDLLYSSIDTVPDDVQPEHLTWPANFGLVVFAKPWQGLDANNTEAEIQIDAMSWCVVDTWKQRHDETIKCVNIIFYRCIDWSRGLGSKELAMATMLHLEDEAQRGAVVKSNGRIDIELRGRTWAPLGRSSWALGHPISETSEMSRYAFDDPNSEAAIQFGKSAAEDSRFISAFFTLLATHSIADVKETQPPRQVARREVRAGRQEASKVKVVYLRRPEHQRPEEGSEHRVNWSHRWVVNAHWRNQPYGPGKSQRKLIMIPPHVKGPDDLPVVVKETVKAWVR